MSTGDGSDRSAHGLLCGSNAVQKQLNFFQPLFCLTSMFHNQHKLLTPLLPASILDDTQNAVARLRQSALRLEAILLYSKEWVCRAHGKAHVVVALVDTLRHL